MNRAGAIRAVGAAGVTMAVLFGHACTGGQAPFGAWAYEVLFVNKRIATVASTPRATPFHPLDAPNAPTQPDCQAAP